MSNLQKLRQHAGACGLVWLHVYNLLANDLSTNAGLTNFIIVDAFMFWCLAIVHIASTWWVQQNAFNSICRCPYILDVDILWSSPGHSWEQKTRKNKQHTKAPPTCSARSAITSCCIQFFCEGVNISCGQKTARNKPDCDSDCYSTVFNQISLSMVFIKFH